MSDNSQPTSLSPLPPGYRAAGVLLHVTSLPSPYGIGDAADNPHPPRNYVPNTVVYTGTHDNATTRGWFEALPDDQQHLWNSLKRPSGKNDEAAWELIRLAWSSVAALAMAPLQDVLNLGAEARMNVPGRAEGNWRWRCTEDMLSTPAWRWLREVTQTSNRLLVDQRSIPSTMEMTR